MTARRSLRIGEVVEIELPIGLLYVQAVNRHRDPPKFGMLYRVPLCLYEHRPDRFDDEPALGSMGYFCSLPGTFYEDYPAVAFRSLGVFDIPEGWREFPVFASRVPEFLKGNFVAADGTGETWALWDGKRSWQPPSDMPEAELERYPRWGAGSPYTLIDEALERIGQPVTEKTLFKDWLGFELDRSVHGTSYFFSFSNEKAAKAAARRLREFGEVVLLLDEEEKANVVLELAPDDAEPFHKREVEFTALANELGASYDGWEAGVVG